MKLKKGNTSDCRKRDGFTLIELIVVVAIVGILTAIVLSSLNNAREKGRDGGVKSNLVNIRGQAEILYTTWGNYAVDATPTYFALAQCTNTADTLFSNANIWAQIVAAYSAGDGVAFTRCYSAPGFWAVAVGLNTGGTAGDAISDSWCVDSSGGSKSYAWTAGQTIADSINVNVCR